jgi:hypothetical protein
MDRDNIQVHFQYGKRAALSGAVACFDHKEYILRNEQRGGAMQTQVEDMIPFTLLNICHKTNTS